VRHSGRESGQGLGRETTRGQSRGERLGRLPVALAAASVVALLAGCGGGPAPKLSEGSHQLAQPAPPDLGPPAALGRSPQTKRPPLLAGGQTKVAPRCDPGQLTLGSDALSYAALVPGPTLIHSAPGSASVVAKLGRLDVNGQPTVLDVTGALLSPACKALWYRVELSVIPNGTTGWVKAGTVHLYRVTSRIVVDLATKVLRLYRSGRLALITPVGVGAPTTPTPAGRYFVDERYVLASSDGPFGPAALGISAHSVALEHSWVEDGPIALHGTDEPSSIGEAASHGCVHVPNAVMRRLFSLAPDGTPVLIQA
jgi:lipoprotein-anchoring transpeptidase ErfK/SrfK